MSVIFGLFANHSSLFFPDVEIGVRDERALVKNALLESLQGNSCDWRIRGKFTGEPPPGFARTKPRSITSGRRLTVNSDSVSPVKHSAAIFALFSVHYLDWRGGVC